nr:methylated-DNA--[protein]-cysteine S-methyltransferase [Jiangella anatolica]
MSDEMAIGGLETPVGRISVAVTQDGLAAVGWGRRPDSGDPALLAPVLAQLAEYFAGQRHDFDLPIDWRRVTGSASAVVLRTLYDTVGYGSSITYGGLADRSGTGVPARAIGGIMGSNPIPIVVPCHRVLASDGLGGYSGGSGGNGLEVKRWLLTLEGVLPPTFDWSPAGLTV